MRRPLLIPLLCFAGGILAEWLLCFDVATLWLAVALGFGAAMSFKARRDRMIPVLIFLLGGLSTALRVVPFSPADLRLVAGPVPVLAAVSGRVSAEPELRRGTDPNDPEPFWRTVIAVERVELDGALRAAAGRVMVFSDGRLHRRLHLGTRVTVFGVLGRPSPAAAVGLFDYREKLRREGIHYQLMTRSDADWRAVEDSGGAGIGRRFRTWAVKRLGAGLKDDGPARLLVAMVLGLRTGLTDEVAEPFMRSGTMHIFAISGLHVAMVSGILIVLLRVLRLPRAGCCFVVVPALWFYCHATGWQASATRATIMMSVIVAGWALRRPTDLLNSVCVAGLVILAGDPLQLLQASFQLSFAVVVTIAVTWPRFDAWGERWFAADPLLPQELESAVHRQGRLGLRWVYSMVAISFSAWLGSMPLIAALFHLWTPGSLLANPPVVVFTMFAIGSAVGGLIGGVLFPPLGEVFAQGAWFWICCQMQVGAWVAGLPQGWRFVAAPSGFEIVTYYALLLAWANRWLGMRALAGAVGGLLAMLVMARVGASSEITVFGQEANAVFCDRPGVAQDLLIDCGRSEGVTRVVVPFLHAQGKGRIENLLLTHGDAAHVEGFDVVCEELSPGTVWISGVPQRSNVYRDVLARAGERRKIHAGDSLAGWRVLHPPASSEWVVADAAAVTLMDEVEGVRLMIMPDASQAAQRAMLRRWQDLKVEVLILGWPKPGEVVLDEFVGRTDPDLIVLQDNQTPVFDRAGGELFRRLRSGGRRVVAVSQHGSVTLRLARGGWSVGTADP